MSEPTPVYETEPIYCRKCGAHLADRVTIGHMRLVKAHGIMSLYIEGACAACGAQFSFNLGRKGLRDLVLKSL